MKKLVTGSLIALFASQLVACVAEDTARVSVGWSFRTLEPEAVTGCPEGYPTIAHYNQPLDEVTGAIVGQPIIDLYDCADNANFTDSLPPTIIQSWVESTDDSGQAVYATSNSAILDIRTQNQSFDVAIFHDAGYFFFDWTLVAASNPNTEVTCDQADADGIEIITTVTGGTAAVADKFDCDTGTTHGEVITPAILAGSYTVSIDAFKDGAGGGALGEPQNFSNEIIPDRNGINDLGSVDLPIDGL